MGKLTAPSGSVFVCYSHDDGSSVLPHVEWLRSRGIDLWFDRGIRAGEIWRNEIGAAIDRATHVLFFVSRASLASDHCDREVQFALDRKKTVIPVFLEDVPLPPGMNVALSRVHALRAPQMDEASLRGAILSAIGAAAPDEQEGSQLRRRRIATPATIALLVALGAGVVFTVVRWRDTPVSTAGLSPIRSIAVMPLDSLSSDAAQEYYADGMTEMLITELSKLPGVRVISRTSVMQFKDGRAPVSEIAKALDVEGIIEGSVMRAGDQVRVTAQLIDARNDSHVWADHYDREAARVLEIQSEVARSVAEQIALVLTPVQAARFARAATVDPRAQDAYFRGLAQRANKFDSENFRRSIVDFEEAVRIAPEYGAAHAALATSRYLVGAIPPSDRIAEMLRARESARRAIELDDTLGEAHSALGNVMFDFDWDWTGAEREYRRGLELGNLLWSDYPFLLLALGRTGEAVALADARVAAAPLDLFFRSDSNDVYLHAGQFERARREAERILEIDPNYVWVLRSQLVQASAALGRYDEAVAALVKSEALFPGSAPPDIEKRWTEEGERGYWRALQERCTDAGLATYCAAAWVQTGDVDKAFEVLEAGFLRRDRVMPFFAHSPFLASVRSDPRFSALAQRMNLPLPQAE